MSRLLLSLNFCAFAALSLGIAACSSDGTTPGDDDDGGTPGCTSNAECVGDAAGPYCDPGLDECAPAPQGSAIGFGDGSVGSVGIAQVYAPEKQLEVTDMAFHPDRPNELWVLRRPYESTAPCNEGNATQAGCAWLEGSIAVVTDPGTDQVAATPYTDPNAWHFMRRPTAFAFGNNATFATVGEARTGNFLDGAVDFMGPSLWSSNTSIFGVQPAGKNGSHLDMLHSTPFGMGIAHEIDNVYWTYNGNIGAIDRYDFKADHGPGNDDHSDGELSRYVTGQLTRLENVPSHLALDKEQMFLYIADAGSGQVLRLDAMSGTMGSPTNPNYDMISARHMDNAVLDVIVPAGAITAPSGIELHDGVLYITDNATSVIHAYTAEGEAIRTLETDVAPGNLGAFTIGPDSKAYYADKMSGGIFRIDAL